MVKSSPWIIINAFMSFLLKTIMQNLRSFICACRRQPQIVIRKTRRLISKNNVQTNRAWVIHSATRKTSTYRRTHRLEHQRVARKPERALPASHPVWTSGIKPRPSARWKSCLLLISLVFSRWTWCRSESLRRRRWPRTRTWSVTLAGVEPLSRWSWPERWPLLRTFLLNRNNFSLINGWNKFVLLENSIQLYFAFSEVLRKWKSI